MKIFPNQMRQFFGKVIIVVLIDVSRIKKTVAGSNH